MVTRKILNPTIKIGGEKFLMLKFIMKTYLNGSIAKSELFSNTYFDQGFNVVIEEYYWEEKIKENEARRMEDDLDFI